MPLIPHNVEAREVFASHLMKEDNLFIVELICDPTKLANALEHLQLVSRAEAAEEATRRAIAQAALDRQAKADEMEANAKQNLISLEAKLGTEFQQQAAHSQAEVQKALIEKDTQIQNQRAEYEATVQSARNDLLQHINSNDTLKGELAASKLRNENAERDMVLRETLVATNATEVLRLSEQQVYNQYMNESKKLEADYAKETERRKVDAAEAIRIAISTNNAAQAEQLRADNDKSKIDMDRQYAEQHRLV